MGRNRMQFQLGLPIAEFIEHYGTEEQCEQVVCQAG